MNRLGEDLELVPASSGVFEQVSGCGLSREEKDLAAWKELSDADGGVDAVHVFHDDVADNQVGPVAARPLNGARAAINCSRRESILVQDDCQGVGNYALVVHYQNF